MKTEYEKEMDKEYENIMGELLMRDDFVGVPDEEFSKIARGLYKENEEEFLRIVESSKNLSFSEIRQNLLRFAYYMDDEIKEFLNYVKGKQL